MDFIKKKVSSFSMIVNEKKLIDSIKIKWFCLSLTVNKDKSDSQWKEVNGLNKKKLIDSIKIKWFCLSLTANKDKSDSQ